MCVCVCVCVFQEVGLTVCVFQEVGLGNIDRCRGFSSHLFKLLLKQRRRLAGLTKQWVHLRSDLHPPPSPPPSPSTLLPHPRATICSSSHLPTLLSYWMYKHPHSLVAGVLPPPLPLPHIQEVNHQRSGDPGQPPEPRPRRRRSSPPGGPPGLGVPCPGSGRPVCHPPPAADLAASVLPGEPPPPPRPAGAGGGSLPGGAQPEVPYSPGGPVPAAWLSDEEGRPRLVSAEPACVNHADPDPGPEGGAAGSSTAVHTGGAAHLVSPHTQTTSLLQCVF